MTTLEDLEARMDSLQKSNAMILEKLSKMEQDNKERLVERRLIKRNKGWDA